MNKELIDLLEKARGVYSGYGSSERYVKLLLYLDQALTLLKQQPAPAETSIGNRVRQIAGFRGKLNREDKVILEQAANRLDVWWKYIGELKEQIKYDKRNIENTYICPCGNIFIGEDDYDTLGSESGICCPDCGNEKFQTVKDRLDSAESENQKLKEQRKDLLEACERARRFISNGIELGYIKMPEIETDPAHETLPIIEAAIAKVQKEG